MHFCLKVVSAGVCVVICVVVWIASSAHTEGFVVMVFHLPDFQVRGPAGVPDCLPVPVPQHLEHPHLEDAT